MTGWGRTTMGGSVSPVLLETNQTVLSNEQCNSAYGGIDEYCLQIVYHKFSLKSLRNIHTQFSYHVCGSAPGKDSCQGDSGGPFFVSENGR